MNYIVDSVNPTSSMLTELDKKVDILKKYPALHIICTGYTCNLGAEDFNNFIGLKRAEAMRSYFVQRGIDGNRIEVKSGGHHNPIAPNDSDANRKKNRRVEISVK
jgi:outer membrane protein OmpA-like peptidoglycan-associated protein